MPQSQYYEQDWNNHLHSSSSQWRYTSPESYCDPHFQHSASYTPCQEQSIEEKSKLTKSLEALLESQRQFQNMTDLILSQNFQIKDPYSIFQVPPQQEKPIDLEKSMKNLIQSQIDFTQSIDRLEVQMSHLVNIINVRNEVTLPT